MKWIQIIATINLINFDNSPFGQVVVITTMLIAITMHRHVLMRVLITF